MKLQIIDTLKSFPEISGPKGDITKKPSRCSEAIALENEIIVVVGSKYSNLIVKRIVESCGTKAYLIDEFKDLDLNASMRSIISTELGT